MNASYAIIGGAILIAAAIFFKPSDPHPRFQAVQLGPALMGRLDTITGTIEICGNVGEVLHLVRPADPQVMLQNGATPEQVNSFLEQRILAIMQSRCFVLNESPSLF